MRIYIFHSVSGKLAAGDLSLASSNLKMALLGKDYVPDLAEHSVFANLTNELASGNGYTAGGASLANVQLTRDEDLVTISADNLEWPDLDAALRYGVIYQDSGDGILVALLDFAYGSGEDEIAISGGLTVPFEAKFVWPTGPEPGQC